MNQPKASVYLFGALIFLIGAFATFFILQNNTKYVISIVELVAFFALILAWNQKRSS